MTYSTFDPNRPRRPINPVSAKTAARRQDRAETIAETKRRAAGQCEAAAKVPEVKRCALPLDTHEVVSRARGGSPYDAENTMLACRAHHHWITTEPAKAEARGLSLPSSLPAKTQLLYDRYAEGN